MGVNSEYVTELRSAIGRLAGRTHLRVSDAALAGLLICFLTVGLLIGLKRVAPSSLRYPQYKVTCAAAGNDMRTTAARSKLTDVNSGTGNEHHAGVCI